MKTIGKWLYIIGLLVAGILGLLSFQNQWVFLLLVLMGILAAIFYLDPEDLVNAGIRFLVLYTANAFLGVAAYKALDFGSFTLGTYINGFFNGVVMFLAPVMLTLLVMHFGKKYFMGK